MECSKRIGRDKCRDVCTLVVEDDLKKLVKSIQTCCFFCDRLKTCQYPCTRARKERDGGREDATY